MKKIAGLFAALLLLTMPAGADPAPVPVHARTSYHDMGTRLEPTATDKAAKSDFVEYFSVPVPGGAMQIMPNAPPPPPAYGPPQTYRNVPDFNNSYSMMANSPYPFGVVNFAPEFDNYSYGNYGGSGYDSYGFGGYGFGGYGFGNFGGHGFGHHHNHAFGNGFGGYGGTNFVAVPANFPIRNNITPAVVPGTGGNVIPIHQP